MSKVWSASVGPHGARVWVAERTFGGPVALHYGHPGRGRTRRSLGFHVRAIDGKLIAAAVTRAKQKAGQLSNRLIAGELPAEQAVTLGEVFGCYRREIVAHQHRKHQADTSSALDFWQNFLGRGFDIAKFGTREWNAACRARESGARDVRGRSVSDSSGRSPVGPRTVAKTLAVLRHVCRFATCYRRPDGSFLLDVDPTRGLPLPRERNPARPICDDQRLTQLLEVADRVAMGRAGRERSYLRELLILAAHSGRRIGAIVALRWSDWSPDRGSYGMLRWRADSDKLGQEWIAPVSPEVREALESLRADRPGGEAWIFPAPRSEGHVRVDVTRSWLRRAEELAELDHPRGFGWHSLRRMWATKRKHLSVQDVAAVGGWRQTQTLQDLYQRADLETMEAVVMGDRALRIGVGT